MEAPTPAEPEAAKCCRVQHCPLFLLRRLAVRCQPKYNCNCSTLSQPTTSKRTWIWTNLSPYSAFRQSQAISLACVSNISCQMPLPWHFCPHWQVLLVSIPAQTPSTVNKDQRYLHWRNWDQSASFPHTAKTKIWYCLFLCSVKSLESIRVITIYRCQKKKGWMRMFDKVTGKRMICMLICLGRNMSLFHNESPVSSVMADIMNRSCSGCCWLQKGCDHKDGKKEVN